MRRVLIGLVLLTAGCTSSHQAAQPTPSPSPSSATLVSNLGANPLPGESTIQETGGLQGPQEITLAKQDPIHHSLVIRWSCVGKGNFTVSIDSVRRVMGTCPQDGGESATVPIDFSHSHKVAVAAGSAITWDLYLGSI